MHGELSQNSHFPTTNLFSRNETVHEVVFCTNILILTIIMNAIRCVIKLSCTVILSCLIQNITRTRTVGLQLFADLFF